MYVPESYFRQQILHSDINYFYAQVEVMHRPALRGKPLAVLGSKEDRSGIVLASTPEAKAHGIRAGTVYWEAEQRCPGILFLPPNYPLYQQYSRIFFDMYREYTDKVEPFGLDESWLDVTGSAHLFGGAVPLAKTLMKRARQEFGLTISVGVSHNKTLAKLGSDMKKPEGLTVLPPKGWKSRVFPLPVGELLYVGRRTAPKLERLGIHTIGDLANTPVWALEERFGKIGTMLWMFANGLDQTPVAQDGYQPPIKSVGNSQTAPYDMETAEDVRVLYTALSESVAMRLRDAGYLCRGVEISLRDKDLRCVTRQTHLAQPTAISREIVDAAMQLYHRHQWGVPLRSIGVRGIDLVSDQTPCQITMECDAHKQEQLSSLENTKDELRARFGNKKLVSARELTNKRLSQFDIKRDNVIHPVGYLNNGA